jgi:hypothetical protein
LNSVGKRVGLFAVLNTLRLKVFPALTLPTGRQVVGEVLKKRLAWHGNHFPLDLQAFYPTCLNSIFYRIISKIFELKSKVYLYFIQNNFTFV